MRKLTSVLLALVVLGGLATPGAMTARAAESCSRETVADLVRTFVRAYNRGNSARLDRLWAQEPDFEWYSVSPDERERDAAYDRETLIPYFERRHELNDRMRLRSLQVGRPNDLGHFGVAYRIRRSSDQAHGRGRYHGKASAKEVTTPGAVGEPDTTRCVLIVWSMGRRER